MVTKSHAFRHLPPLRDPRPVSPPEPDPGTLRHCDYCPWEDVMWSEDWFRPGAQDWRYYHGPWVCSNRDCIDAYVEDLETRPDRSEE